MNSGSRYERTPTAIATVAGREVHYKQLRILPSPPPSTTHRVAQEERLDHIAHRYFGDSLQFWRICDANRAIRPTDLLQEVGRPLKIPFPQR